MKNRETKRVRLTLDEREVEVEANTTVLETAKRHGIRIPTLCYHPALRPSGSCKVCTVEMETPTGRRALMLACVLRAKEGMKVRTTGEAVDRARRKAFHRLLALAPHADGIRRLAEAHGIDLGPRPDGCIRCRLCLRVCKEIVGPAALEMQTVDGHDFVMPLEGRCIGCGTCANICPTGAIRLEDRNEVRTIRIREELIGRHPLQRCEGCGSLFATPRFLDHVHDRVSPHPDLKEHHAYCPTCAKLFSKRIRVYNNRK